MHVQNHPSERGFHDAFVIRKGVCFLGLFVGALSGFFLKNWSLGLAIYFSVVTFLDFFVHDILKSRSSWFVNPQQLMSEENISPANLDRYHKSRRSLRLVSFFAAFLSQFFVLSPVLFCSLYVGVTSVAVLYIRFVKKVVGPVWLRRDERYYFPGTTTGVPYPSGKNDLSDMNFGRLTGVGPYGFLKSDS